MSFAEIITARGLAAAYNNKTIWQDANFTINRGEFIGLLGANGAGKTTLFRILLGLAKPADGDLLLFGQRPRKGNARVGYIPQRRYIDNESRIESIEYIRLGLNGTRLGFSLDTRHEEQLALEALELVGGKELAHKSLSNLSGGELQRVFLAQALIGKPDLLLLDEPLANLDIRRETQLIRLVHEVVQAQQISVLLIAHDINPLLPVVDRIIYIANGRVASGAPHEVITSEMLSKLYNAPIEVLRSSKGKIAVLGAEEEVHHNGE